MTERPRDSRDSGEVARRGGAGALDAEAGLSVGLSQVVSHARELARTAASPATMRLGRERLLASALRKAPPVSDATARGLFGADVLSALHHRASGLSSLPRMAAIATLAIGLGVLSYTLLRPSPRTLALSNTAQARAAAATDEQREQPLTYSSHGGRPSAPNYLVAPAHEPARLEFSDGSEVTASPGARLRIDSTQSRGARVLLEQGVARAHVTHRDRARWVFVAGPFDVRITGTTFTLGWDASAQVLDLTLHEGSVEVDSPLGASRVKVKTGQRFHASVVNGTMQLMAADDAAETAASDQPALRSQDPDEVDGRAGSQVGDRRDMVERGDSARRQLSRRELRSQDRRSRARIHRAARRARARAARRDYDAQSERARDADSTDPGAGASYTDLVRAGAFEQVVEAANRAGLAQTLQHDSADDVRALADAARYLHRTELAVRSLTVLRARFPGTHHSSAAAFLLGRTYENAEQLQAARRFYELYGRESPHGEFAAEALAGCMRSVAHLDGAAAGRPIAQQYLKRYPRGVHAKTARALLRAK